MAEKQSKTDRRTSMKKGVAAVISLLLGGAIGTVGGAAVTGKRLQKRVRENADMSDKHLALYLLMNEWVHIKQDGKSLSAYFEKMHYKKIAVYGMNFVGETLLRELENSGIEVAFAIDKNAERIFTDVDVILPDDVQEEVDAIVVTPISYFDSIEEMLQEKVDCPILSMEDIIKEM